MILGVALSERNEETGKLPLPYNCGWGLHCLYSIMTEGITVIKPTTNKNCNESFRDGKRHILTNAG